ncbi:tRNA pseudouridine(55) synthase TruB [candidate division WS5 bacterium]|uniref:tRNA pseudouridine synthase B n=1 Tax=candidate division WS5 bacterium TaxID=2093353 RepID=A0A419DEN7_9BACT|nr:MAG: tRNA pseudouridine(55) synthase TruB [candidate division WS5 bacterium]
MKEGIYLIDKEAGWTSFDVVAKMRGITGIRSIGHAGTLDPFATGLLIILVGKEFTKRQDEFMKQDKEYETTLKLGEESSTGDPEGIIVKSEKLKVKSYTDKEIRKVFEKFIGEIEQRPPAYSAIKIGGERAYKKARRGEEVEMPRRKVEIHEIELLEYRYPFVKFRIKCSSGTYIRTLGQDIAESLGTRGYLTELRRTKIGAYDIGDAQKISNLTSP